MQADHLLSALSCDSSTRLTNQQYEQINALRESVRSASENLRDVASALPVDPQCSKVSSGVARLEGILSVWPVFMTGGRP